VQDDSLLLAIDGVAADDIRADLVSLEVELDDELAGMFRITLPLRRTAEGWTHLDDERLTVWRKVTVTAGVADDSRQLLIGYITHVRPDFGAGLEQARLEVWGMDASVLMDRVEKLRAWPNKKDSDIAGEILADPAYGLTAAVTDTAIVHDEKASTVMQRETDVQLVKRLAVRNGYEFFVDGDTAWFRPPAVDDTPQPVLSVLSGDGTNVSRFSVEVNALSPASVTMYGRDRATGEPLAATATASDQKPLGAELPAALLGPGMDPPAVYIGQTVASGTAEMAFLCQGLVNDGDWVATGTGEVMANVYGSVLMPRGTVTITGIGRTYSGVWYVTHVTHRFTDDGYTQEFRVKRNALRPTGREDFSGAGGLLGALAGAL
jgi:phage protein D